MMLLPAGRAQCLDRWDGASAYLEGSGRLHVRTSNHGMVGGLRSRRREPSVEVIATSLAEDSTGTSVSGARGIHDADSGMSA